MHSSQTRGPAEERRICAAPPAPAQPAQDLRATPRRSLWPREHGAYGQLAVPLVAALASGRPGLTSAALVVAIGAAFLAHEPVLVLAGHRGPRVRRDHGARARRRLLTLAAAAIAGALVALAGSGVAVVLALTGAVALAAVVAVLVAARREKTLAGECVAASALAAAAVPVAVSGGVAPATALWAWVAWTLGYAAVTAAVRDTIARGKRRRRADAPWLLVIAIAAVVALAAFVNLAVTAAAPLAVAAIAIAVAPPSARHLRRTGWALVVASVASGVVVVSFTVTGISP